MVADAEETLLICRIHVYLWRGQLLQGRGKGSSLANPACNKQYNMILNVTVLSTRETTALQNFTWSQSGLFCNIDHHTVHRSNVTQVRVKC